MWPMLIGAGLGALTNKDALKGALMGAAMGGMGGDVGGLLGGGVTTPQTTVDEFGSIVANPEFKGGLLANLPTGKQVSEYAQPIGQSIAAAGAAKNLLGTPQTQLQSHAPQVSSGGSQVLAQLYQPYQMQPRQRMNWG